MAKSIAVMSVKTHTFHPDSVALMEFTRNIFRANATCSNTIRVLIQVSFHKFLEILIS